MIRLHKYHGLGNDFLIADLRSGVPVPSPIDAEVARRLCDRRFGVGADGVLGVLPSRQAAAAMRIRNADGSEPEMCGNGIRCVAKFLYDGGLRQRSIPIETASGVLECEIDEGPDGRASAVTVSMGRPVVESLGQTVEAEGRRFEAVLVSMGNPHAVIFVGSDEDLMDLARRFGPGIERHERFPGRINVEFARVQGSSVDVCVWERGCGITLACGTGACATAVAAVATDAARAGQDTDVRLPGGRLRVRVGREMEEVWMTGPAVYVYSADVAGGPALP